MFSNSKMLGTRIPRAVASSSRVWTVERLEEIKAIRLAFISYAKLARAYNNQKELELINVTSRFESHT